MTLPFRAFLATSSATFLGIIEADRASRSYSESVNPEKARLRQEQREEERAYEATHTAGQRVKAWMAEHRYHVVFGAWAASMGASFAIVGRSPYLTTQQKLVQARVYAQGLTLAVLLASFAFEASDRQSGKGRWETVKVLDPDDPTHKHLIEKRVHHERYKGEDQWMEMIEAEEKKEKERKRKREEIRNHKKGGEGEKKSEKGSDKGHGKEEGKQEGSKKS